MIDSAITKFGYMDTLASHDSFVHRLDPRAKLLTTLVYMISVISFEKYATGALLPFTLYPIILMTLADLPVGYLIKRVLWVSPFAVLVGIFNPLLDQQILLEIGSLNISGGWISFVSLILRFFLTVLAAYILIASTGFYAICQALEKIGVPNIFVMQLLFLYRYAFVLGEECARIVRSLQMRAPLQHTLTLRSFTVIAGSLFIRTTTRAQRIYQAMCCRGYAGQIDLAKPLRWQTKDTLFSIGFIGLFLFLRFFNPAFIIGQWLTDHAS